MPPLAEAFADFKGFKEGEPWVHQIHDLLMVLIQRHRRPAARRFYSTRDLAKFFGVSGFTILTVYRRLHREGLLTLVRASQTMIPPRAPRTRFAVRGTVAMPIWMPAFISFIDWRRWLTIAQQELAHYRFVAEPIFIKLGEEDRPDLVDRVLQFDPSYVLWFYPSPTNMSLLLSLTDAGVPLLTVNGDKVNLPSRAYPTSTHQARQQGIKEWQESGEVDEIIVPLGGKDAPEIEIAISALKNSPLPYRFEDFSGNKSSCLKYLTRLTSQSRKGIIFFDDLFYSTLCLWEPEAMLKLFRRHRTMTERHVVIPGCDTKGITVDRLEFSWRRLARRIALDLSEAKGAIFSRQTIFQAEWRPQTPLAEVSLVGFVE